MLKILFLLLTFAAIGLTVFYGIFYESPVAGSTYQDSYAILSLLAAIIFAGLFYALFVNKEETDSSVLMK